MPRTKKPTAMSTKMSWPSSTLSRKSLPKRPSARVAEDVIEDAAESLPRPSMRCSRKPCCRRGRASDRGPGRHRHVHRGTGSRAVITVVCRRSSRSRCPPPGWNALTESTAPTSSRLPKAPRADGENLLLYGPTGTGKTHFARRGPQAPASVHHLRGQLLATSRR